ncbi:hypothetical protein HPK02_14265 [Anoxybacillus flavithermus]|nr:MULTISPECIES: hypothetical protein [Bacillaceae]MBE2919929.1 hypothetical protein [Anoxybacillus flavithermus]MBE2922306.1 hypothetical protein [Anoxybacillus flavithermus]
MDSGLIYDSFVKPRKGDGFAMVDRNILEKWELEKNIKSKIIEEVYDYLKKCKQEQKKKHLEEIDVFRILYPQDIYLKFIEEGEEKEYLINISSLPNYQLPEYFFDDISVRFNRMYNIQRKNPIKLLVVALNLWGVKNLFETPLLFENTKITILDQNNISNFSVIENIVDF